MDKDSIKEEYRARVAEAVALRDSRIAEAGEDEDARKAASAAFDEWNAAARAKRASDLASAE